MSDIADSIREQAPLSNFPDAIIEMEKVTVPTRELLQKILTYNTAVSNGNWTLCESLIANNPELKNCKISSTKFNTIIDEIKAIELYYLGEMDQYFTNLTNYVDTCAQNAIGLNDGEASLQTSYSSQKVNELLAALTTVVDFVLPAEATANATGWVEDENDAGETIYTNTLTNVSSNLTDSSRPIWYPTHDLTAEEYESFCYIATMEAKAENGGTLVFTCPSSTDYPSIDLDLSIKGY